MPFEQRVALAGSHRDPVSGASSQRAADKNEIVHTTLVLRRRTQTRQLDSAQEFGFTDIETTNFHTREAAR